MNDFELSKNINQTEVAGNRQASKTLLNFSLTSVTSLEMNPKLRSGIMQQNSNVPITFLAIEIQFSVSIKPLRSEKFF